MELAKELRIGNYLNYQGKIIKVEGIHNRTIYHSDRQFDQVGVENYITFEPIPLTEEWLLRFGFIRKYVSHTPYILNDISIYPTDANFYNIVYYKGVKIDDIILKSVSQLQNLYFSLTNNELKLIK